METIIRISLSSVEILIEMLVQCLARILAQRILTIANVIIIWVNAFPIPLTSCCKSLSPHQFWCWWNRGQDKFHDEETVDFKDLKEAHGASYLEDSCLTLGSVCWQHISLGYHHCLNQCFERSHVTALPQRKESDLQSEPWLRTTNSVFSLPSFHSHFPWRVGQQALAGWSMCLCVCLSLWLWSCVASLDETAHLLYWSRASF